MPEPTRILFVCLGNICRSPLAEGIFIHLNHKQPPHHPVEVDSAGTGHWHVVTILGVGMLVWYIIQTYLP